MLQEAVGTRSALGDLGLDAAHGPSAARYNRRKADWIDEPFQTLDCTLDGFAQGIRSFPFGRDFQHVAHCGTTLGQLHECIVFYQLVLNVPLRGAQGKKT